MEKIAIVIVTYNRVECLKKCIRNLEKLENIENLEQEILVIDNNSDGGTEEFLKKIVLRNKKIKYKKLEENTGGAGGFSAGIRWAYESGADYIWGMDDDAYVEKDSLTKLYCAYKKINELCCMWSNCDNDLQFEEGDIKKVSRWMFVGFFLPREIIEQVGYPREDFFIYHDDCEYANRIRKNNINIYKVKDSVIKHKDAVQSGEKMIKQILGVKIERAKLSDWKLYYFVRNAILMHSYKESIKYRTIFLTFPKYFFDLLILNPRQCGVFLKAYCHGIFGISGKRFLP